MPRKLRSPKGQARPASPYMRYTLALGEAPTARLHGWVAACSTGGADNRPETELVAIYGAEIRDRCHRAGFRPAFDVPLSRQSAEAQHAAARWAVAVIREGAY